MFIFVFTATHRFICRHPAAFTVTDIEPISGPVGTTVTLTGEDFDQQAGVKIEDLVLGDPAERNLFANNFFSGKQVDPADDLNVDVTAGPPPGVALLIAGTSEGNIVGEAFCSSNLFQRGSVGVYIDGANNNTITGNIIGGSNGVGLASSTLTVTAPNTLGHNAGHGVSLYHDVDGDGAITEADARLHVGL